MIILANYPSPVGCVLEVREIGNNQLSPKTKNQCMCQTFSNTQRNEYMYLISQRQEGVALTRARGYPLSSTCAYFFIVQQILFVCVYVCVRVRDVHICACARGGRGGHQLSCSMPLWRLFLRQGPSEPGARLATAKPLLLAPPPVQTSPLHPDVFYMVL